MGIAKPALETAIDPALRDALQLALKPTDPPANRKAAVLARVLARARTEPQLLTVRVDDGEWVRLNPLVEVKKLFQSSSARALLYRVQPGGELPAHEHPTNEECLVISGEMMVGDLVLRAGDFHFAPKGIPHIDIRSASGALFYVRTGVVHAGHEDDLAGR
jgi:quercetin dioxygenase-like cupin family protein